MAENYLPLTAGYQRSLAALKRHRGMGRSPLYEFLKDFAVGDRIYQRIDFTENAALADYRLTPANSAGTSAANFAVDAAGTNGTITGDTGTDDNGSISLIGPIYLLGDNNAGMAIRWKVDDVSENNFEIGLIDAVPGSNASGINDEDTPTATAADCALVTYDNDETAQGLAFFTIGSTAGQGIKKTAITDTLVDGEYRLTVIQLIGNSAYCLHGTNNRTLKLVAKHDDDPQGNLEGGVKLGVWVYDRTRNTTAKFPTIDFIEYWMDRV